MELGQKRDDFLMSRLAVLELKEESIVVKASIDKFRLRMGKDLGLEFFCYKGSHALVVGVGRGIHGMAHVFDYNTKTGELRKLNGKEVLHEEKHPPNLVR